MKHLYRKSILHLFNLLTKIKKMKKTKILLGLLIAYALNGCSLLGETEPDLPPATQTGANTIGFKVNGKNWVPRNDKKYLPNTPNNIDKTGVFSIFYEDLVTFAVSGKRVEVKGEKDSFFRIDIYGFYTPKNYYSVAMSYRETGGGWWSATKNKPCKLEITKLDTVNYICSGTFSFTGVDKSGSTVEITDGRFDVKYKD